MSFVLFLSACEEKITILSDGNDLFYCDAEVIVDAQFKTTNQSLTCNGGSYQSSKHSKSGKHSVLSSKENPYVMSVEINDIVVDGHYRAEIWRLGNNQEGKLVVQGDEFWEATMVSDEVDNNGWEKLVLEFYVPPNTNKSFFKVFFWNTGEKEIFVDDFRLQFLDKKFPQYEEEYLRIEIDDFERINKIRKKAFKDKMIITSKKSFVRAMVYYGDKQMPATVRLKGDWLDHLEGKKWSFRIQLDKGYSWKGMRTFNIQTPKARSFLDEWVAHKIAEKEDILTTRYEFVPVNLNGENLGIYVYEEHFEKHLIENKNRREGPIIKFSEDHLWRARRENLNNFPFYESALILPFKQNKTIETVRLNEYFNQAKNQLNAFRNCSSPTEDIFDIDKTAKFLAFTDLTKGQHGLIWHNLRFYFNPIIFKLEPIAYDLYSDDVSSYLNRSIIGNFNPSLVDNNFSNNNSLYHLFKDSVFTSKYINYLEKFSDEDYINGFLISIDSTLNESEKNLIKEFENYKYDRDFLKEQQQKIREELPQMKQKFKNNYSSELEKVSPKSKDLEDSELPLKLIPFYFHIYKTSQGYEYVNYFPNKFKILGYLDENKKAVYWKTPMNIEKYNANSTYHRISLPENFPKKKFRLIVEKDSKKDTVKCEWLPWEKPAQVQLESLEIYIPEWMQQEGDKLIVRSGNYTASKLITLPPNFKVIVEASTTINFEDGAGFWSESPVFFQGTKANPISIIGGRNVGFTVVNSNEKSVLNYTNFSKLGTFIKDAWQLTGAVNFYEADVEIINCVFMDNRCEDALNIVRSEFLVSNCAFYTIFSDAFDSDFSSGELLSTEFVGIANDAIDFSGSRVLIKDCNIQAAKDKGISGGENSQLVVENCKVTGCKIAVASKDKSLVKIDGISVKNCEYGLVAFRKKPEYGPAIIESTKTQMENVSTENLIEEFSKLILDGKTIEGIEKNVVERFY